MKHLVLTLLFMPILLFSQTYLDGIVFGENNPLVGANIQWINSNIGVTTDQNGEFTINKDDISEKKLIISFIGFLSDTIEISNSINNIEIHLKKEDDLNTIYLTDEIEGIYIVKKGDQN